MKIAVMDIGTNNTRMAVFDAPASEKPDIVIERDTITRLGENLRTTGVLSEAAMARTLAVLDGYKKLCDAAGAERFTVAGTAAMRAASNSNVFINMVREIGLALEIIPGELEAELSFRGVVFGMDAPPDKLLMIDVGGGSTEFAYGEMGLLIWAESVPVGAVVATEKYFRHDPPSADEIAALNEFVADAIKKRVLPRLPGGFALAGVAGTVSTLAMIDLGLEHFDPKKVHGHILSPEKLSGITKRLLEMNNAGRTAIPGMEPQRADIIHAGAAILAQAAELTGGGPMLTSLCDLRHGLLERAMRNSD
jgi:exopolyphosphatase / guanosine-5'-triphosphate,3'-diphosphate pyrophosphatase